jgi:isopentenyl-diphosphate delta-isomerase
MEEVILVDDQDRPTGTMEKMEAHEKGQLHRAFSIFVFNSDGELLLHQRAFDKYHSGGLWTNTCCSHPRPGETVLEAGHRRLMEEMGMACELDERFTFLYRSELDQGLIEHELDHVIFGVSDELPVLNPEEVAAYRYASLEEISDEMADDPDLFTEWFKICFAEVLKHRNSGE